MKLCISTLLSIVFINALLGQTKFAQLEELLPTANEYRTASGAPGHKYWQQKVDYAINLSIDEKKSILSGDEVITYTNNSPDVLTYLWLQLDQNNFAKDADKHMINQSTMPSTVSPDFSANYEYTFDGGFKIVEVTTENGKALKYTINKTMMRVDLLEPLKSGGKTKLKIKWWYNITNSNKEGGRSGYEPFPDGNNVYCIAQFFPRLCKYYDVYGWQNKQFLGRGEFTVDFGDYQVAITVPEDYVVSSTGTLQNESSVLTATQQQRLADAKNEYNQPVVIATLQEAQNKIAAGQASKTKTWKFSATNVRDFAFAGSRRFIWDAMNTKLPSGKTAMAMSMWLPEGDCLWSKFSTKAVAHTLKWYSHYTTEYPYPVAWSIDGDMGMEYPMIAFNYGRCEADGTYAAETKYGHIGVVIHEVGHNFFPMIINSDERQWTWMDEGLNSFVEYLTSQQWERNFPSRRGPATNIVDYMKGDKSQLSPIMTNSESIFQFGNNAYGKPATALNILRETVMGRELFDKAFKDYCERWRFKTPTPADFFRTMEDASGVDLDWFWRAWFYGTDPVDLSLANTKYFIANPKNPDEKFEITQEERKERNISSIRNEKEIEKTYNEIDPSINDFYTTYDSKKPDALNRKDYESFLASLTEEEKKQMEKSKNFYELEFENVGGNPMPVILEFTFEDKTTQIVRIPAEIWRFDEKSVKKLFGFDKKVINITLDPFLETADIDRGNNYYPKREQPNRFEVFKQKQHQKSENPMQRNQRIENLDRP